MAELTQKERLQPSLLDRLTDHQPDRKVESRDERVLSPSRLRECVRRDLAWLLSTPNFESVRRLEGYPEVANSVLNFGMPPLAGHTAHGLKLEDLEAMLHRAILTFEPRLTSSSVRVKVVEGSEAMTHNALAFHIEAELWAQPLPLRLFLKTEIDLESGLVEVEEATGAR
jgi:type VI secretion system protein ImpF